MTEQKEQAVQAEKQEKRYIGKGIQMTALRFQTGEETADISCLPLGSRKLNTKHSGVLSRYSFVRKIVLKNI